MWLLIKVKNEIGVGNDEEQRILINERTLELNKFINFDSIGINITAKGTEVHPSTPDESDCFFFEGKYNKCLNKEFTQSLKDRFLLSCCLRPEKCREYVSGYEHGIKKDAQDSTPK